MFDLWPGVLHSAAINAAINQISKLSISPLLPKPPCFLQLPEVACKSSTCLFWWNAAVLEKYDKNTSFICMQYNLFHNIHKIRQYSYIAQLYF